MRIISGEFRSRRIKAPPGTDVRPTSDRTREAIFNVLVGRLDLAGMQVADLYAGSGALGLEALSRGAAVATFVEANPRVMRVLKENARFLGAVDRCEFRQVDVAGYLRQLRDPVFDVVFADPPYSSKDVRLLPEDVLRVVNPDGFLILEHDRRHDFSELPSFVESRRYGGTIVTFFRARFPQQNTYP